jgi:hypothetical protein
VAGRDGRVVACVNMNERMTPSSRDKRVGRTANRENPGPMESNDTQLPRLPDCQDVKAVLSLALQVLLALPSLLRGDLGRTAA